MSLDATGLDTAGVPDLGALSGTTGDLSQVGGSAGTGGGGLDLPGGDFFDGLTSASEFGAEFSNWDMDLS
jgi:mediator of RNA polymerase II transcription subunit 5